MTSIGPPHRCALPLPAVTINVWPSGCVCHAVRAPGSKVTLAAATRAGAFGWTSGSMRTEPVNQSAGPLAEGCEPLLLISIFLSQHGLPKIPYGSIPIRARSETAARQRPEGDNPLAAEPIQAG